VLQVHQFQIAGFAVIFGVLEPLPQRFGFLKNGAFAQCLHYLPELRIAERCLDAPAAGSPQNRLIKDFDKGITQPLQLGDQFFFQHMFRLGGHRRLRRQDYAGKFSFL